MSENWIAPLSDMRTPGDFYTSLLAEDHETKVKLYNATVSPDQRLADMANLTIDARDVIIEVVSMENKETGENKDVPRVVIIDTNGVSYVAVSVGVFNAVRRIFSIFGPAPWPDGLKIKVKSVARGNNKVLSLEME